MRESREPLADVLARASGREPATPDEVRQQMGLAEREDRA